MCSEVILYHLNPLSILQTLHIATDETVVSPTNCIQWQLLRSGVEADVSYTNCRPAVLNAHIFHTGGDSICYLKPEGHTEENLGEGVGGVLVSVFIFIAGKINFIYGLQL